MSFEIIQGTNGGLDYVVLAEDTEGGKLSVKPLLDPVTGGYQLLGVRIRVTSGKGPPHEKHWEDLGISWHKKADTHSSSNMVLMAIYQGEIKDEDFVTFLFEKGVVTSLIAAFSELVNLPSLAESEDFKDVILQLLNERMGENAEKDKTVPATKEQAKAACIHVLSQMYSEIPVSMRNTLLMAASPDVLVGAPSSGMMMVN